MTLCAPPSSKAQASLPRAEDCWSWHCGAEFLSLSLFAGSAGLNRATRNEPSATNLSHCFAPRQDEQKWHASCCSRSSIRLVYAQLEVYFQLSFPILYVLDSDW